MYIDTRNLCVEGIDYPTVIVVTVEGPDGTRQIRTVADIQKLADDFNDELNTALTERENLRDQLVGIAITLSNIERARQEGYAAGYEAAMLENASWDLD